MTEEQHNKFLTLLMGECWHEWVDDGAWNICQICGDKTRLHNPENPNHLSNPLLVIRWMEKEMPGVLDNYLHWCFQRPRTSSLSDDIFFILDLRNLVQFLVQNPEWATIKHTWQDVEGIESATSVHPALRYAREEG